MPTAQDHVSANTPMGANLTGSGATFRVWAPRAVAVYVITGDLKISKLPGWTPKESDKLLRQADGTWTGFVPGMSDGSAYRFWVVGQGTSGYKRDPYARELSMSPAFPDCNCIVRDPASYPWYDHGWRTPAFSDLIIYQFHIGTYYAVDSQGRDRRSGRVAKFLDVLDRVRYLHDLGVNAIQPLPVQEYETGHSMGYNGTDYFSPEVFYQVEDSPELDRYLATANALLAARECAPLRRDQLKTPINQLKALIDICHIYGIAVIFDVVYNHAGGGFDDQSMYFFDRMKAGNNNDSLYFTDQGFAGGLVFAYSKPEVRQFLIENAKFYLSEYHIDGFRYDEVSAIDEHGGWRFGQDLTSTVRFVKPDALQNAEYWKEKRWLAVVRPPEGMGFDCALHDGLRDTIRNAIGKAAGGRDAHVNFDLIKDALHRPYGFEASWETVQHLENQDLVYAGHADRQPRIAALSDPSNARSWYARSRSRVATGLLLTAPGIPMLFMGQEFLEDKYWSDNPDAFQGTLVWWDGLTQQKAMADHLRFTQELIELRRRYQALRGESINVFHTHNDNRVIAFQRWVEGVGRDVVVVGSLNESTFWNYQLGFPGPGRWLEVFNSDVYDNWVNPSRAGNGGSVTADDPPLHGLSSSSNIVLPSNSLVVFARDAGDGVPGTGG